MRFFRRIEAGADAVLSPSFYAAATRFSHHTEQNLAIFLLGEAASGCWLPRRTVACRWWVTTARKRSSSSATPATSAKPARRRRWRYVADSASAQLVCTFRHWTRGYSVPSLSPLVPTCNLALLLCPPLPSPASRPPPRRPPPHRLRCCHLERNFQAKIS